MKILSSYEFVIQTLMLYHVDELASGTQLILNKYLKKWPRAWYALGMAV